MFLLGPRDRANEITDSEELQIVEAYAEAEEDLDTDWSNEVDLFGAND